MKYNSELQQIEIEQYFDDGFITSIQNLAQLGFRKVRHSINYHTYIIPCEKHEDHYIQNGVKFVVSKIMRLYTIEEIQ